MKSCGSGAMIRFAPTARQSATLCSACLRREVGVAHLGGRAAAAPLLAHEPELDAGALQQLRERARVRGPVEGRLAVDEQDRLAADRDVEALGPVGHVLLADRHVAEHRLVVALGQALVPQLPALALVAGLDHQRAHRLDDVDRARAVAVEVAGEQRVRAAQLAGPALRAVHVVVGHVLDVDEALLHRDDVRVERGRRVVLVARDLHDRADLAAELVPGGEAPVRVRPPLLDELVLQPPIAVGLVAVVPPVAVHRGLLHRREPNRRRPPSPVRRRPGQVQPPRPDFARDARAGHGPEP